MSYQAFIISLTILSGVLKYLTQSLSSKYLSTVNCYVNVTNVSSLYYPPISGMLDGQTPSKITYLVITLDFSVVN